MFKEQIQLEKDIEKLSKSLERIIYFDLPSDIDKLKLGSWELNTKIPLPYLIDEDSKEAAKNEIMTDGLVIGEDFDWDPVTNAMLVIFSIDPQHKHIDYYRQFIIYLQPNIISIILQAGRRHIDELDFYLAEQSFFTLRGLLPEHISVLLELGSLYEGALEVSKQRGLGEDITYWRNLAEATYKQVIYSKNIDRVAYWQLANYFLKNNKFKQAGEYFRGYLDFTEDEKDLALHYIRHLDVLSHDYLERVQGLIEAKDWANAEEVLQLFLVVEENYFEPWLQLAELQFSQGKFTQAIRSAETALNCKDHNLGSKYLDAHYLIALSYENLRELEEASKALLKIIRVDAEHLGALFHYGLCLFSLGNFEEAQAYWLSLEVIDPIYPKLEECLAELNIELTKKKAKTDSAKSKTKNSL